jgi:LPXTG-site transpeptidase (sortase) family protein
MKLLGLGAAVGLAVCLTACGSTVSSTPRVPTVSPSSPPEATAPQLTPTEITVPAINAHSSLVPLGLVDPKTKKPSPTGELEAPDVHNPMQAGFYKYGVMPCSSPGPAVIIGHVDGRVNGKPAEGIFFNLKKLAEGDTATVTMSDGRTCTYRVYQVVHVDKAQFPTDRVYGNTDKPELRMITCGDQFVGGELGYKNNIIAFARLAGT